MVAAVAALWAPLDVVVFGVLAFGVVHLSLEVRWVVGRFRPLLHGRLLAAVSALLFGIVLVRFFLPTDPGRRTEAALLAATLAVAAAWGLRGVSRAAAVGLAAALGAWGVTDPHNWVVAQAWAHNAAPAVFVWVWSASLARSPRRVLRSVTLLWAVVLPVLVLSGATDALIGPSSSTARSLGGPVAATFTPDGAGVLAPRMLAVFAFLLLMHYATWVWHFPKVGTAEVASFEETPAGHLLRGWRLPALGLAGAAVVASLAAWDYWQGRAVYASVAAYHAYLEYPVLLALLVAPRLTQRTLQAGAATSGDPGSESSCTRS